MSLAITTQRCVKIAEERRSGSSFLTRVVSVFFRRLFAFTSRFGCWLGSLMEELLTSRAKLLLCVQWQLILRGPILVCLLAAGYRPGRYHLDRRR